jgi:hypothetical protein
MNASDIWNLVEDESSLVAETKWVLIRRVRDELLSRCDWTQLPDATLSIEEKQAWSDYRQELRDIPQNFPLADDVVFPSEPGAE